MKDLIRLILERYNYVDDITILDTYWQLKDSLTYYKKTHNNFKFKVDESNTSNSIYVDIVTNRRKYEIRISDHKPRNNRSDYYFTYDNFSIEDFENLLIKIIQ